MRGSRVTLIDADPQGSALDWSQQRAREGLPYLFGIVGLARGVLHREAPELARDVDHVVIVGPPRVAGLMRPALVAATVGQRVVFATHPANPDSWIKAGAAPPQRTDAADAHSAPLTVDITPALRGRIKIAAFQHGMTVADMLRDLLAREFSSTDGGAS